MLVLGVVRAQPASRRVIRVIFGIGFFCYGFYLTLIFSGGHYVLFFQAFILPVLLIMDFFRTRTARRQTRPAAASPPPDMSV